jgi:hypothetical protein
MNLKGKDKVNVHKRSSSDSQSHLIPKSPPKAEAEEFNNHHDGSNSSDIEAAALLPKS